LLNYLRATLPKEKDDNLTEVSHDER
jgi:hypothetical protein